MLAVKFVACPQEHRKFSITNYTIDCCANVSNIHARMMLTHYNILIMQLYHGSDNKHREFYGFPSKIFVNVYPPSWMVGKERSQTATKSTSASASPDLSFTRRFSLNYYDFFRAAPR